MIGGKNMNCIHCGDTATCSITLEDCTFYLCNKCFIKEYNNRFIDGECLIKVKM